MFPSPISGNPTPPAAQARSSAEASSSQAGGSSQPGSVPKGLTREFRLALGANAASVLGDAVISVPPMTAAPARGAGDRPHVQPLSVEKAENLLNAIQQPGAQLSFSEDREWPLMPDGRSIVAHGLSGRNPATFTLHLDDENRLRRLEVTGNDAHSSSQRIFEANFAPPERGASTLGMRPPAWLAASGSDSAFASAKRMITPPTPERDTSRARLDSASPATATVPLPDDNPPASPVAHGHADASAVVAQQEPVPLRVPPEGWKKWLVEGGHVTERHELFGWLTKPLIRLDHLRLESTADAPGGMSEFAKRVFLKSLALRKNEEIHVGTMDETRLNEAIRGYANDGMLKISPGMLCILPATILKDLVAQEVFASGLSIKIEFATTLAIAKNRVRRALRVVEPILEAIGNEALVPYGKRKTLYGSGITKDSHLLEDLPVHPLHRKFMEVYSDLLTQHGNKESNPSHSMQLPRSLVFSVESTMDPWTDSVFDREHTRETLIEQVRVYRPDLDTESQKLNTALRFLPDALKTARQEYSLERQAEAAPQAGVAGPSGLR